MYYNTQELPEVMNNLLLELEEDMLLLEYDGKMQWSQLQIDDQVCMTLN